MNANAKFSPVLSGDEQFALVQGDAFDLLRQMPAESVDLVITSPPYWGLRDYEAEHNWEILDLWAGGKHAKATPSYQWYREHRGLLGLEPLPEWYVANLTEILGECQRVLKMSGSMWLNIGDTYFARWSSIRPKGRQGLNGDGTHSPQDPDGRIPPGKAIAADSLPRRHRATGETVDSPERPYLVQAERAPAPFRRPARIDARAFFPLRQTSAGGAGKIPLRYFRGGPRSP